MPVDAAEAQGLRTRAGESRGAVFGACGRYRYLLWRRLGASGQTILFVMLNPSTADEARDDATIRACTRHARRRGAAVLLVANLYALRSTDPRGLRSHPDPVGPENDAHLAAAAQRADRLIMAWGDAGPPGLDERAAAVCAGPLAGARLHALGRTRAGRPRHPLYLATSARLRRYALPCGAGILPASGVVQVCAVRQTSSPSPLCQPCSSPARSGRAMGALAR